MNHTLSKPSFLESLRLELPRALSRLDISTVAARLSSSGDPLAYSWAQTLAGILVTSHVAFKDATLAWQVETDGAFLKFEGVDAHGRIAERFHLHTSKRPPLLKKQHWSLNQQEVLFGREFDLALNQAAAVVCKEWTAQRELGNLDWSSCSNEDVLRWQTTLLRGWSEAISASDDPLTHAGLLALCFSHNSVYWVSKVFRKDILRVVGTSRHGNLHLNGVALPTLQVVGPPILVNSSGQVRLEIPLSSGLFLFLGVKDSRADSPAVTLSWTLSTDRAATLVSGELF